MSSIRTCGINVNHWYVVALGDEVGLKPLGVTLWQLAIAVYRDQSGQVQAVEDRCPHRQVKLSEGKVVGNNLECAYHGWQFTPQGYCAKIPYFARDQTLPPCQLRTYPVLEKDGFIWLYPGDLAYLEHHKPEPLALPEWSHLNYIGSVAPFDCPGHFSYLIENLMDMYHGHLHDHYQAWASASLRKIYSDDSPQQNRLVVDYDAQSYYKIDHILAISQLFLPALRKLHPETLRVSYLYPHWVSSLGADFKIYCLLCPVSLSQTKAYLVHFTSLEAFPKLHKLPIAFRRFLKNRLTNTAKPLLNNLIKQDVRMIAQEQAAFNQYPDRPNVEVNPALGKVQQLIRHQAQA